MATESANNPDATAGEQALLRDAHRSIVRNAGFLLLAKIISRTLRVIYMVLLARHFGPELFGLFNYAQFWLLLFLPFALFGGGQVLVREIGVQRQQAEKVIGSSATLRSLTTFVSAMLLLILGFTLEQDIQTSWLLAVFAWALIFRSIAAWIQHVFIAFEATEYNLRQELVFRSLEVILGLGVLWLGGGLMQIALVHGLCWLLQALFGWRLINRHFVRIHLRWQRTELLALMHAGALVAVTAFAVTAMLQGALVLYRQLFFDPLTVGQLAVLLQVLGILVMAPRALAAAALPILSRLVSAGKGGEHRSMSLMLRISIIISFTLCLPGFQFGGLLLHHLVGEEYQMASGLLGPTLWILLPFAVGFLLSQLNTAHGRYTLAAVNALVGALGMSITLWWFGSTAALDGVLLAIASGVIIWAALGTWAAWRYHGLALGRALLQPVLVGVLASLVFWLMRETSPLLALVLAWLLLLPGVISPGVLRKYATR